MKLCECGCGEPAPLATRTQRGYIAGQPQRFVSGHNFERTRGPEHPSWRGGSYLDKGYVTVSIPPNHRFAEMAYRRCAKSIWLTVREHRLVMAEHLGRPLAPEEVVHHVNGVRDDNRIENLRLFESHEAHATYHEREAKGADSA